MIDPAKELADSFLITLATNGQKHLWIGNSPPYPMASTEIRSSTNFRLSSTLHGSFDVVWYYTPDLGDFGPQQWKIIVDELIRLIGPKGCLVLRYRQNKHFSVIGLKHFLSHRLGLTLDVLFEEFDFGIFTTVLSIERNNYEKYKSQLWTFGLLTVGKRPENVVSFLQSVRKHDKNNEHEIIIVGPENDLYTPFAPTYLHKKYSEKYAQICKKKNDIAAAAKNPNLLIAHDRYRLNDNFFDGFDEYGYDFDFLTIKQWYESGDEFPSYCAMSEQGLVWSPSVKCDDYQQLAPTPYINGGLIIAKTHTLRAIPFNNLLFWNQAEDVELCCSMLEHSITPRINFLSSATTLGIDRSYTGAFKTTSARLSFWKKKLLATKQYIRYLILKLYITMPHSLQKKLGCAVNNEGGIVRYVKNLFFS